MELTLLDESTVGEDEIDSLGHMNVRFYVSRMDRANSRLLAASGFQPGPGQTLRRLDTYTRFHREQFAGAKLHTLGALMPGEDDKPGVVRGYYEIRNPDNGQPAASFIVSTGLVDLASQTQVDLSELAPSALLSDLPDHGKPRSLSLKLPRPVPLATLEAAISDTPMPGMMSGRREGQVTPQDCASNGWLREDVDLMFLVHRPGEGESMPDIGPPLLKDDQGRRYSWAMMETRTLSWARPKSGDRILSIGADIACGDKWRQSRRWMFVLDTGLPLGVNDTLGLCLDLDARKAISIPADVRAEIEQSSLPEFA